MRTVHSHHLQTAIVSGIWRVNCVVASKAVKAGTNLRAKMGGGIETFHHYLFHQISLKIKLTKASKGTKSVTNKLVFVLNFWAIYLSFVFSSLIQKWSRLKLILVSREPCPKKMNKQFWSKEIHRIQFPSRRAAKANRNTIGCRMKFIFRNIDHLTQIIAIMKCIQCQLLTWLAEFTKEILRKL